jgi:hypothetical protein
VAGGEKFVEEVTVSAHSVRGQMPGYPIAIVTDQDVEEDVFDVVLSMEEPEYSNVDKVREILGTPFDRTLFLDTDTYVCGDASDIFLVLDRFDIAAAHSPGRRLEFRPRFEADELPVANPPDAFPQFNSGVVAFKRTSSPKRFFAGGSRSIGTTNNSSRGSPTSGRSARPSTRAKLAS